ncbi:hypothetical protein C8Q78DRAFT_1026394 [Trametes maxima]|nr:hypothetical protein C8Q78DRAFT_1026394 [Trametes maxima]
MQDVAILLHEFTRHVEPAAYTVMPSPPTHESHSNESMQWLILRHLVDHRDEPIPLTPGLLRPVEGLNHPVVNLGTREDSFITTRIRAKKPPRDLAEVDPRPFKHASTHNFKAIRQRFVSGTCKGGFAPSLSLLEGYWRRQYSRRERAFASVLISLSLQRRCLWAIASSHTLVSYRSYVLIPVACAPCFNMDVPHLISRTHLRFHYPPTHVPRVVLPVLHRCSTM